MKDSKHKVTVRHRRHARVRSRLSGTAKRPRLSVFRSNRAVYAQLIDDHSGSTLAHASSSKKNEKTLQQRAAAVGKDIAAAARAKKITEVVFDRGGFLYTGIVKAVADGAREGGLQL